MTKTLFIGQSTIRLNSVDSTNNYARALVRDKMPMEGTVIVAEEQTAGRGQRFNSWVTEPHLNLTCSYILKPVFLAAKDQFILSAAVALAVRATVANCVNDQEVTIKWPNDILVGSKKIAGILIENMLRGSQLETSIVGIGLNVKQTTFPDGLNATSLRLLSDSALEIEWVMEILHEQLERFYLQIRQGNLETVLTEMNRVLFGGGEERQLSVNGADELVRIIGVQQSGELELEHADGSRTLHQHHEIGWYLS
ncbi:MAG: biotin--[acetyl-CoA-carboxylase] ligase [Flavobacteriales bacterium]|nr:biotin--[acetyl-CoA-carboxylase] ligase [Flavobacteriales bacterium]